jgi:hypothetical protein
MIATAGLLLFALIAAAPPGNARHIHVEIGAIQQWKKPIAAVRAAGHRCFKALSQTMTEVHHDSAGCMKRAR